MDSAEITALATLCSVLISSIVLIWRTVVTGKTVTAVDTKTSDVQAKTTAVATKTDTIAQKVDGNIDQLISLVSQIHDTVVKPHG